MPPSLNALASFAADRPPPTWVTRLDDEILRHELGNTTFDRGHDYYRKGAVHALSTGDRGRLLLANVRGSAGRSYQTLVTAQDISSDPDEPIGWVSRCSCPMQTDCKHVVAVILAARALAQPAGGVSPSGWESALGDLVRDRAPAAAFSPLALQVEVTSPKPSRYAGAAPAAPRLGLRPVVRGKNGGWIRTGASWRDLEYPHGRTRFDPDQREAVLALSARAAARRTVYYGVEATLHLDELGPSGWRLLRETQAAGIPLVSTTKGGPEVLLAAEPATVVLDVRASGSGAIVSPRISIPGSSDVGSDHVGPAAAEVLALVGDPAHGVFVLGSGRLVLAAFERPVDQAVHRLLARGTALEIPGDELPRFLRSYYPRLLQRVTIGSSDASVTFPKVRPPLLALAVAFEPDHVTQLRWEYAYPLDDRVVSVPLSPAEGEHPRDRAAELALQDRLGAQGTLDLVPGLRIEVGAQRWLAPRVRLTGIDTVTFVERVLPVLQERDDVLVEVTGSPAEYTEAQEAPLISVSATDTPSGLSPHGTDWFDLGVTVTVAGEEVPFLPLFTALARGDGELILGSGTWFRLDRPELHTLRRLIEEARGLHDREPGSLRVTPWQVGLWEELVSLGVVAEQSERWQRTAGALLDLTSIPRPAVPAGVTATLRHYQEDGYHWLSLLWDLQLGGILADDMGLGKTLQTLAMAARAYEMGEVTPERPLLIVAPTSVVSTWAREAARFCPELRVVTITQTHRRRCASLAAATAGAHLVVTSYALLRLEEEAYRSQSWSGLVVDEAQFVKNHQAKTYQCIRRMPAPFKLAITGTPLENSLMDLWSLLSIVAPGLFPSPQRFTELYRTPIESGAAPELLGTLRRRIRPLMLRRTKEEVAQDLPPKVEQVLEVTLNPAHQRVYETHLQRERQRVLGLIDDLQRNRIAILRSLTVLRQLSLDASLVDERYAGQVRSSKIDVLMEHLHELAAEGHRALVFSQFTGFLALVRDRLSVEGIDHVYLDGRTRDRPRRIAEFTDGDAPVFLISLKAGGSGLTLTEADYVFVLDPWWNPATEAQAVDRTHRIGQDKTVMVYRLVASGTIEEKVVALQQRKRALFESVVEADGLMGAPMTADDIRGLLGP